MPQYYFTVHRPDGDRAYRNGLTLPNLEAALAFAEEAIVQRRHDTEACRSTTMIVLDEQGRMLLSLPFLPACA